MSGGLTKNAKRHQLPEIRPLIKVGNVYFNELRTEAFEIIGVAQGEIDRTELRVGDLLIVEGNGSVEQIGRVALWDGRVPGAVHQNHLIKVRVGPAISEKFLLWWLISPEGRKCITERASSTSGLHTLSISKVESLPTPLAPPKEQERIVAKLEELFSELDAGVEALRRAQIRLSRYRQALLQFAVTGELTREWRGSQGHDHKLGQIESKWAPGWRQVTVEQIAAQVDYGSSAKTQQGAEGIPVIRMGNIQDGCIVMDDVKTLPSDHPEFPKLLLQPGDLLFNRTNSAELVGKSAVFRGKQPTSFASYLIRVRLDGSCVPEWLAVFINSTFGRRWVASVASQQVGQANVNGSKLRALQIPLPPMQEQQAVLTELDQRLSATSAMEASILASLNRAERLRQSILERAFKGELVPQDPKDESSAVLLSRLTTDMPQRATRGRRRA